VLITALGKQVPHGQTQIEDFYKNEGMNKPQSMVLLNARAPKPWSKKDSNPNEGLKPIKTYPNQILEPNTQISTKDSSATED
jgi:hypothetical protein